MIPIRYDFEARDTLMDVLATTVADRLRTAVSVRGRACLAVPGGTTPGPFLAALSEADLDWRKIAVTLTDERWVPPSSDRSNHRLLLATLFRGRAASARFISLVDENSEPEGGISMVEAALFTEVLPLDVCVLGMGADLHIASLFPGGNTLAEALSEDAPPVVPIHAPGASEPRVSLTAPVLRGARHLFLLITGEAKAIALKTAFDDGSEADAPVRAILRAPTPLEIFYAP